jgi:hypothetical protein
MVSGSQNMELLQARATAPPDAAHPAGAPCRLACRVRLQALRVRLGHGHPSSPGPPRPPRPPRPPHPPHPPRLPHLPWQEFYETTLKALQEAKNDRLWFKTNLKLGKLWFDMQEYGRLQRIIRELHRSCQNDDGSDDLKKGTQLLEARPTPPPLTAPYSPLQPLAPLTHPHTPHTPLAGLRARDPNVHGDQEQQEAQVALQQGAADQERHTSPQDHGRHPRVRRQDAHGRARVAQHAQRAASPWRRHPCWLPLAAPPLAGCPGHLGRTASGVACATPLRHATPSSGASPT